MVVAAALAGVFTGVIFSLSDGISDRGDRMSSELRTDIVILNDPTFMPYDNDTKVLTVYVKNIGQLTLDHHGISVLIDGAVMSTLSSSVLGDTSEYWIPATVIQMEITIDLTPGDHQLKVITENGVSNTMQFRL